MPNPAAIAYETYRQHMNGHGRLGCYMLPWEMLSDTEKAAWWAVVESVLTAAKTATHHNTWSIASIARCVQGAIINCNIIVP